MARERKRPPKYDNEEDRKKARLKGLKPFVKGDPRINKNGRPKTLPGLDKILTEVLGGWMEDGGDSGIKKVITNIFDQAKSKDNTNAVRAATLLLERAYGKDPIVIKSTSDITSKGESINKVDVTKLDDDTLAKIVASLKKEE